MKKSIVSIALFAAVASFTNAAQAQISQGGLPLSKKDGITLTMDVPVNKLVNPLPTVEAINEARAENEKNSVYNIGKLTAADVKFPESGVFEFLDNGSVVWKTKIVVEGAPAVGLYFDQFDLPKGVSMFVYNGSGSQMLGAYTEANVSPEDKLFSVQAVQGNVVNIELNIAEHVDLNRILVSVNQAAVYFDGISHLEYYHNGNPENGVLIDTDPYGLQGRGASCNMDAACYEQNWDVARRATLQMISVSRGGGIGMCSAAMINGLGNSSSDCKNFILTASHCQSNSATDIGDTVNSAFTQTQFRFNFEKKQCNSSERPGVDVVNGANLLSRSYYNGNLPTYQMEGDFMLLQLRVKVPANYNSVLAGWDLELQPAYNINSGQKYIGYHHPSGDIKKVSFHHRVLNEFDHFVMTLPRDHSQGAIFGGTSGSALFNNTSRIIGIASTASGSMTACPSNTYADLNYYKFNTAYDFEPSNPKKNLKAWLDPNNTGARTANPANTQTCAGLSVIEVGENLDKGIQVYPNPSNTGIVNLKFDFEQKQNVTLEIYNVLGARISTVTLGEIGNYDFKLDMSNYNDGIYMIKCSNGKDYTTKKVTIAK